MSLFAILVILASCSLKINDLEIDENAKEIFNQMELEGILEMIRFVDENIPGNSTDEDINEKYHTYFEELRTSMEKGEMITGLVKDSVKFKFLESLDKEALNSIWIISDSKRNIRTKDTTLVNVRGIKSLQISVLGSYMNYLNKLGESDEFYRGLHQSIEISGDFPPSMLGLTIVKNREFDFSLFKDRLWATVFILQIGDTLEEKVERYLRDNKSAQIKK